MDYDRQMDGCEHEFYYYPAVNEDGWKCVACGFKPGEEPGYDPNLDERLVNDKVNGLMMDMMEANLIYISNNDMGSALAHTVTQRCRNEGLYDQYAIIRFIMECLRSHEEFWKKKGDSFRKGEDVFNRCKVCDKIAKISSSSQGKIVYVCSDHWSELDALRTRK